MVMLKRLKRQWRKLNTRLKRFVTRFLAFKLLSKMLSRHMKRSEISYDIVEDIVVQGDRLRDTFQELQDAVYLTKALVKHKCLMSKVHQEMITWLRFVDNGKQMPST